MEFSPFYIAKLPRIAFGEGAIEQLPEFIREFGSRALLVTGRQSLRSLPHWEDLMERLQAERLELEIFKVPHEPSPKLVDEAVARFEGRGIEVVVGIGGGSALDAAKAIAGLLPSGNSVVDYLEDVGRGLPFTGPALPFIAVPTTAGTGSEATKNAVLSELNPADGTGYKKSFRHESLVAQVAIVDPVLLANCPAPLIAAQGMDAFTQLLESYVSLRANPFTDALAWSGMEAVSGGFFDAWRGGEGEAARRGRAAMAYAALLSGITLAQVGLGSVHGLVQPLGSLFPVPHGIACGTTLAAAVRVNVAALRERDPQSPAWGKYAQVGRLLSADANLSQEQAEEALVKTLESWTEQMAIPRLGTFGVSETDLPRIVAASRNNSMKTNPIALTDEEVAAIILDRL